MKTVKIKTKDEIKTSENLLNFKRWFNGMKKFASVKLLPRHLSLDNK